MPACSRCPLRSQAAAPQPAALVDEVLRGASPSRALPACVGDALLALSRARAQRYGQGAR